MKNLLIVMVVVQSLWAGAAVLHLAAEWRLNYLDAPGAAAIYPWDYKYGYIVGASNVLHKNFPDAASRFESVLSRAPRHVGALINLAGVYAQTGDKVSAQRALIRALALSPSDPKVMRNLKILRGKMAGKYEFVMVPS